MAFANRAFRTDGTEAAQGANMFGVGTWSTKAEEDIVTCNFEQGVVPRHHSRLSTASGVLILGIIQAQVVFFVWARKLTKPVSG